MKSALHQQVLATIREHRMLRAGDRVGVAVSGGGDSVALLLLLAELRAELGVALLVVHLNHQLRGAESDADEQFVADLARSRGLDLASERRDVAGEALPQKMNLEEAGRRLRYEFFAELIRSGRAARVAVAHTADDQAETVLARLLRGTGPTGLVAIYPVVGAVIRPLLATRRAVLREYLASRGQPWREDASNLDATRLRARIRQKLLPPLEAEFQPAVVDHLAALAGMARSDEAFWSALLEERFRALVARDSAGLAIRIPDLLQPLDLPAEALDALRTRLVRRIVAELKAKRAIARGQMNAQHVEQVLHLAAEGSSGRALPLPGGIRVERRFDRLIFSIRDATAEKETPEAAFAYEYDVALPQQGAAHVTLAEIRRRVRLKVIDWPPAAGDTRGSEVALDAELLRPPLVLRNWRPGDAYRPCGSRSVRKLKHLFLDRRIAVRERASWPVLTSAGRLAWASGMPAAAEFEAHAGTRSGLLIDEESL
jgi:tRNA(Ile)-lysidine synthase